MKNNQVQYKKNNNYLSKMAKSKIPFEYRALVTTVEFLLKCVAIWPLSDDNFYSRFGPYLYMFTLIFTMFGIFYSMMCSSGNIGFLIKTCFWLTGDASVLFKIMTIHFNRKELKKLYEILETKHYVKLLKNSNFKETILKGMYCNILHVLTILYSLNLLSFSMPLFNIIRQFISGVHPIQYQYYFPLNYPWYPISPYGFMYNIHFLIVSTSSLTLSFASSTCDALFFLYIIKIIGHLRQLTYDMKNFNNNDDDYHVFTRKVVIEHVNLIFYCHKLEKIFGPLILWFTITNAVLLVGATYMVFQLSHLLSFGDTIQLFAYVLVKLLQAYVYGYFGSCLQKESENYRISIYSLNWLGKEKFMSSIVIMLSQKPLTFNICSISVLSVELFSATLNTTISYYFLLKTLDN
uniref:Odorant receptor n=1 Tax=Aphidius gifuensis TaxID=684658 RepID=A0A3S9LW97_APHGI|nr:odorant receptor [Aphidius gifuensis]